MAAIEIFDPEEHEWLRPVDAYPAVVLPDIPRAELEGTRVRFHHPGSATELQMFEVQVDPDLVLASHAHDADEIIAVIEGELHVGRRVCGVGASICVRGGTLYSVKAGPEGCRFLNFRGAADVTYHSKERFLAARSARAGGGDDG